MHAVFDGHYGSGISQHLADVTPRKIADAFPELSDAKELTQSEVDLIVDAVKAATLKIDNEVCNEMKFSEWSGSTFSVFLQVKNYFLTAHLGDGRMVLRMDGQLMPTEDHKPENKRETERINQRGGVVVYEETSVPRVQNLAYSRSIGDCRAKISKQVKGYDPHGVVSADADVKYYTWNLKHPVQILLATDGLWDVVNSDGAMTMLMSKQNQMQALGDYAQSYPYNMDDVSIIFDSIQPPKKYWLNLNYFGLRTCCHRS